jgi:hypothetical protein
MKKITNLSQARQLQSESYPINGLELHFLESALEEILVGGRHYPHSVWPHFFEQIRVRENGQQVNVLAVYEDSFKAPKKIAKLAKKRLVDGRSLA